MSLISENGLVSLIVPNKFISNQYGELLREYITQSKMLRSIINFGSIHVFKGKALNYTCIVNLSKSSENKVTNNRVSDINDWVQNNTVKSTTYPEEVFSSKPWIFPSQDVSKIIQKCQKRSSQTLGDIADIYVGLQTSADNIYVIKEEKQDTDYIYFKKEGITYHVEKEILKPFILDLPLHPFTQPKNNSWLIFPYEQSNGESKVYSEELMKSRFPNAYKYLLANKSALVERSITGGKKVDQVWYQFGRSQSLNKMDREKIILPVQSKTYRYTPDINGIYLTGGGNGPYYLISPPKSNNISIHLLLAILNNEISESQVKLCTSIIGNGYYAHNKEFIENLLIPKMSEQEKLDIESISKKIISLTNELEYSKSHKRTILVRSIQSQKEKLNQIIISLFGLSNDEFDILKSVSPE
ncbi:type II restriction enzyme, methylase subunit [Vibrio sp. JCM 18904]|nr:type II restriction enzyme, methylase subunit [Vibrio sp. JCM 18904]